MPSGRLLRAGAFLAVSLVASLSRAQCTMDNDCKGDRVCERGSCVAPSAALPPAPAAPAGAAPATVAPVDAPAPVPVVDVQPADAPPQAAQGKPPRHSTGMMVGGIVMVSFSPVALMVAGIAALGESVCNVDNAGNSQSSMQIRRDCNNDTTIYGGLIAAAVMVGVGVPLIVIGAKREPVGTAVVAPFATPTAAGLGVHVNF